VSAAGPSPRARLGWLAAYAAATFGAFPHPVGGHVVDLGLGLAWLAPACLLLGLRGLGPRQAAAAGFGAGLAAHALVFHWIYVVTVTYGHGPPVVGVLAPLLLAVYPALFAAVFGAAIAWAGRASARGLPAPWLSAAAWTALDHGKTFLLTGFPWALLGYAQHLNPWLLGLAPWTGVFGLGFVTVLGAAAAVDLALAARAGAPVPRRAVVGLGVAVLAHGLGAAALAQEPRGPVQTVRVGLVQGDIDQGVKWSPTWAERTLEIYEDLTRRAVADGARIVLWPETAVPGSPDASAALTERLGDLARETRATLVVGAVGLGRDPDHPGGPPRYFDSAFVFGPDGAPLERYDKAHLVPFGEYLPFRALLGHFVEALARGVADTDVSAGAAPRALELPVAGPAGSAAAPPERVTVGVPICYELLFPNLVRHFVEDGAEALLAITNDAWYGRTGAPYQFLAITALRSAENRVWTARAANTGVSAIIDDRGRVREQTRIFERTYRVADVALRPPPLGGSFYTRHGDWFAFVCWGATVLGVPAAARRTESA
jgi:apolipoprotein N-acyltransferase